MNDIFDNPVAMKPLFSEVVSIRGASGVTSVTACVLDMGLDDPFGTSDAEPGLAWWSVRVHAADLPGRVPRIRDVVKFIDGREVSVARVTKDHGDYELTCRGKR